MTGTPRFLTLLRVSMFDVDDGVTTGVLTLRGDQVDELIRSGAWPAGHLADVETLPGPDAWPDHWLPLKRKED